MGEDIIRADKVDVQVSDNSDLPEGWEQTHTEERKPIKDGMGYYIYSYESEYFLVTQDTDVRDGETFHYVTLLCVKRDENGNRKTALGTGVYETIGVEDGKQAFPTDDADDSQFDINEDAHKEAEKAAFQVAVDLMNEVNNGKHKDRRYSE